MFAIASSLPLLLQIALLLFFIGLGLFLYEQEPVIAWATTGVMVVWFGVILLTITMPMFTPQCPYKIPMLAAFSHWVRFDSLVSLHRMSKDLWDHTPRRSLSEKIVEIIRDWLYSIVKSRAIVEETTVSKNCLFDVPTAIYARDVLRGERLNDSLVECFRDLTNEEVKDGSAHIPLNEAVVNCGTLPGVPYGPAQAVGSFAIEAANDEHLRSIYFGQEIHSSLFSALYFGSSRIQSKTYVPDMGLPITDQSLAAYIHLVQASPTSAAFSFLTMYSIRYYTLTDYTNSFRHLFLVPSNYEMVSYGIGRLAIASPSPL